MIRVTVDLNNVVVGGRNYLSTMAQSTINKYACGDLIDLEKETKGSIDDAENEVFIAYPENIVKNSRKLFERIQSHIPATKIEIVEDLFFS